MHLKFFSRRCLYDLVLQVTTLFYTECLYAAAAAECCLWMAVFCSVMGA